MALKELGRYKEALSYEEQSKAILRPYLTADPHDTRAENDLLVVLENEAECFEDRAQGVFAEGETDRTEDANNALRNLSEARSLLERLLQTKPDNVNWRSTLGLVLVRMSLQQRALYQPREALESATKGVAILKAVGKQQDAQGYDLDAVATGLTVVWPEPLRDPQLAVECAERMVAMSHHQKPGFLLTLARAYRSAGQPEKARAAAKEGIALLPVATPTTAPSRVRKQLQAELAG